MPPRSVDDLARHLRALNRAQHAWLLLAAHVWCRLAVTIRNAFGADVPDERFISDPDIPRTFSDACASFQELLQELNEFHPVAPDFPWLWCGGELLTSSGPLPNLDGWLNSVAAVGENEWKQKVVDPFMAGTQAASAQFGTLRTHFEGTKEEALAASSDQLETRFRVTSALELVRGEEDRTRSKQADRRQRLHGLFTAAANAAGSVPPEEFWEQWSRGLSERLVAIGLEVTAQRWDDWFRVTAEGDPVTQELAKLMLTGDKNRVVRQIELLPYLPAELDKLRDWLKTLIRRWPTDFDRGWLRWQLARDFPHPPRSAAAISPVQQAQKGQASARADMTRSGLSVAGQAEARSVSEDPLIRRLADDLAEHEAEPVRQSDEDQTGDPMSRLRLLRDRLRSEELPDCRTGKVALARLIRDFMRAVREVGWANRYENLRVGRGDDSLWSIAFAVYDRSERGDFDGAAELMEQSEARAKAARPFSTTWKAWGWLVATVRGGYLGEGIPDALFADPIPPGAAREGGDGAPVTDETGVGGGPDAGVASATIDSTAPIVTTSATPSTGCRTPEVDLSAINGKVDVGIITVREDEFRAVLKRFPARSLVRGGSQFYQYARVGPPAGPELGVAVVRCLEQGQGFAQSVTRDLLDDLNPPWLFLVGIGGGVPRSDYSLGDVMLASRLNDFSVSAASEDQAPQFSGGGGPMHPEVENLLAHLPALARQLQGWNRQRAIGSKKPGVVIPADLTAECYYGDDRWKRSVQSSLRANFPDGKRPRVPRFFAGPIVSSNTLVKDAGLLRLWLQTARHAVAVEMELGGVYLAAHRSGPWDHRILAIRSISDIVGFKRGDEWTAYACHSAAAFASKLLRSGVLHSAQSVNRRQ
jgi:nucleoside phosphorylase